MRTKSTVAITLFLLVGAVNLGVGIATYFTGNPEGLKDSVVWIAIMTLAIGNIVQGEEIHKLKERNNA